MRTILNVSICFGLILVTSGCLKTRAQLQNLPPDDGRPIPAQKVQEVEPQGQYVIDEIKGEITRLTGRIEDLERKNQQDQGNAVAPLKEEIKKLEGRIQELEQAQATLIENLKKAQAALPQQDLTPYFEKGKSQFESKDYEGAVESLTTYLKNPKGKFVESATFFRAESYFALKQYKKAIVDYSKFPEKYTHSKRLASALYKIGAAFEALGMKEDAKGFYQELVDKFPKAPEAKKAKSKLR